MGRSYWVYILTNCVRSVLYIGVTNDLERRLYEHKSHLVHGFTDKYQINRLIYYEETTDISAAIEREKQLKKWSRSKKEWLIATLNPFWNDLSDGFH
ncbi:MAG: GIY-YIG nuclease family protein [Patescibacteria group bacterium]|nr:GIY-YIG nuclease family protein [Patescibacteria group bacterium]